MNTRLRALRRGRRMDTNDEKLVLKEEVSRIVGYAIEVLQPSMILMPESSYSCYPCNPWLKLL